MNFLEMKLADEGKDLNLIFKTKKDLLDYLNSNNLNNDMKVNNVKSNDAEFKVNTLGDIMELLNIGYTDYKVTEDVLSNFEFSNKYKDSYLIHCIDNEATDENKKNCVASAYIENDKALVAIYTGDDDGSDDYKVTEDEFNRRFENLRLFR